MFLNPTHEAVPQGRGFLQMPPASRKQAVLNRPTARTTGRPQPLGLIAVLGSATPTWVNQTEALSHPSHT